MQTSIMNSMCRCCASEGAFKDVKTTYLWMGEDEVYGDMLKDCFDIALSTSDICEGGICEVCITQLRNAANFKKQVLHTEEQFKKQIQTKFFKPNIVKVELPADDILNSEDNNLSGDDAFSGTEYEIPIKIETAEEPKTKKRAAKASTSRTKKQKTGDTENAPVKRGRENTCVKSENDYLEKNNHTEDIKSNIAPRTELVKHRNNIREILLSSNATPIRRYGGIGYTCCYCEEQYEQAAQLKEHTLKEHTDISQANFMKNMNMSEYVVKLDISWLHCKLCNTEVDSLEQFIDHLIKAHNKNIFTDIKNHILPFKFENELQRCLVCSSNFNKFRTLVNHMHKHYRNFVCGICDSGFVNRNGLAQHSEKHRTGSFPCGYCPKVLNTHMKRKIHERSNHTHRDVLNKCGYCCETFKDYRKKEAHLTEAHGVRPLTAKCQACDKVFSNRKLLTIHIKRDHLMERSHKCKECDMKFFSTTGLKNHIVKHTKLRAFCCEVCRKSFGRKKTLNSHMRIHEDTQRYKCEHCGQSFVQKCSWRRHMRTKHGEIV